MRHRRAPAAITEEPKGGNEAAAAEHVLLASDYPFDMGELDCVARVEALPIPPAQRDAVFGGSAEKLPRNGPR